MLAPLELSVPAADGLILKGTLTYPTGRRGERLPLAVLAHQYPATRDTFAPLVRDLLAAGVDTLAVDQRGHGGTAHAMAIYFDIRDELVNFLRKSLGVA
jgi:dipeptidyl aminopeptidase/acylaminoacyl peptidase